MPLVRIAIRLIRLAFIAVFGGVMLLALLVLGTCGTLEYRARSSILAEIPQQLEAGHFLAFKQCDWLMGGEYWVVEISPEAAHRLQTEGRSFLTPSTQGEHSAQSAPEWEPSETTGWDWDGGSPGLSCMGSRGDFDVHGQDLLQHLYRKGGYYRRAGRSAVYIVPSLNVVVGGSDPR